ncbi:MAG: hypothetical protein EOP84_04710 [Verrucomicrobiaceae bacterium]|nr:MAG: hypothetical protein EOP84_04710 [Verrucomicrobiaceae bacterium]
MMVGSHFPCVPVNVTRVFFCIISTLLFLPHPALGQTFDLGRSNGHRLRVEVIRDPPKGSSNEEPHMQTVKCRFIRVDKEGRTMTWEEEMGPGYRVQVRVEDFLRRKRKQVWIALTHGAPDARLFDFDGEKVTTVYDNAYENAGRVYPTPKITSGGTFEILEEFDQSYEDDFDDPVLFNPETNLVERLIRWNGTEFVPVDVLKLPWAKQTPRARRVNRYKKLLRSLTPGNPASQVKESLRTLKEAGRDAFPVLLQHLDDHTRVRHEAVPQQVSRLTAEQRPLFQLSIGDACFEVLQEVIEGRWPERFTHYHALNRINVGSWVKQDLRRDIRDLREDAAESALRFAHEVPPKGVDPVLHKEAVEFLRTRLEELKQ